MALPLLLVVLVFLLVVLVVLLVVLMFPLVVCWWFCSWFVGGSVRDVGASAGVLGGSARGLGGSARGFGRVCLMAHQENEKLAERAILGRDDKLLSGKRASARFLGRFGPSSRRKTSAGTYRWRSARRREVAVGTLVANDTIDQVLTCRWVIAAANKTASSITSVS